MAVGLLCLLPGSELRVDEIDVVTLAPKMGRVKCMQEKLRR